MKLIKEIKRRARNVTLAVLGKEPERPLLPDPLKIEAHQAKVETFRHEQTLNPFIDEIIPFDQVVKHTRREMARDLGMMLLDAGAFKFEILEGRNIMGLPGHTLRLEIKLIRPEEVEP